MLRFEAVPDANAVTVCAIWEKGACSATDDSSGKGGEGGTLSLYKSEVTADFTVQVPAGMRVDALIFNGAITVRAAGPVKAHTLNGSVKVGTAVGPVDAETINGDVDVRMTTMGSDSGGPVCEITGRSKRFKARLGTAARHCVVSTMSGSA